MFKNIPQSIPNDNGIASQVLTTDGSNNYTWATISSSVTGPGSSTATTMALFADTSGAVLSDPITSLLWSQSSNNVTATQATGGASINMLTPNVVSGVGTRTGSFNFQTGDRITAGTGTSGDFNVTLGVGADATNGQFKVYSRDASRNLFMVGNNVVDCMASTLQLSGLAGSVAIQSASVARMDFVTGFGIYFKSDVGAYVGNTYYDGAVTGDAVYPWKALFSRCINMGYSSGDSIPADAPHTIRMKTGTNLTISADKTLLSAGIGIGNSAAASVAVGVLANKFEIFDAAGTSLGYVPIYATIT